MEKIYSEYKDELENLGQMFQDAETVRQLF